MTLADMPRTSTAAAQSTAAEFFDPYRRMSSARQMPVAQNCRAIFDQVPRGQYVTSMSGLNQIRPPAERMRRLSSQSCPRRMSSSNPPRWSNTSRR